MFACRFRPRSCLLLACLLAAVLELRAQTAFVAPEHGSFGVRFAMLHDDVLDGLGLETTTSTISGLELGLGFHSLDADGAGSGRAIEAVAGAPFLAELSRGPLRIGVGPAVALDAVRVTQEGRYGVVSRSSSMSLTLAAQLTMVLSLGPCKLQPVAGVGWLVFSNAEPGNEFFHSEGLELALAKVYGSWLTLGIQKTSIAGASSLAARLGVALALQPSNRKSGKEGRAGAVDRRPSRWKRPAPKD